MADHAYNDYDSRGALIAVLGTLGLTLSLVPFYGIVAWLLCPPAVVMGWKGRTGSSLAKVGFAAGLVGLAICVSWVVFVAALLSDGGFGFA